MNTHVVLTPGQVVDWLKGLSRQHLDVSYLITNRGERINIEDLTPDIIYDCKYFITEEQEVAVFSRRQYMSTLKTFKQIDEVWEAYCKMTDVEVSDSLTVSYNPSETTEHKVELFSNGKSIYISTAEARLLAEKLMALTSDVPANDTNCRTLVDEEIK